MAVQIVRFFVQRHGQHNGDLTEEGKKRVQRAAKKNLSGVKFHYVFSSEQARARQTALEALIAVGQEQLGLNIKTELGFGYSFAMDPRWSNEGLLAQIIAAKEDGVEITVDFVLSELRDPPCLKTAGGLLMTMHQWAERISEESGEASVTLSMFLLAATAQMC